MSGSGFGGGGNGPKANDFSAWSSSFIQAGTQTPTQARHFDSGSQTGFWFLNGNLGGMMTGNGWNEQDGHASVPSAYDRSNQHQHRPVEPVPIDFSRQAWGAGGGGLTNFMGGDGVAGPSGSTTGIQEVVAGHAGGGYGSAGIIGIDGESFDEVCEELGGTSHADHGEFTDISNIEHHYIYL